jgi:ribonuclease E
VTKATAEPATAEPPTGEPPTDEPGVAGAATSARPGTEPAPLFAPAAEPDAEPAPRTRRRRAKATPVTRAELPAEPPVDDEDAQAEPDASAQVVAGGTPGAVAPAGGTPAAEEPAAEPQPATTSRRRRAAPIASVLFMPPVEVDEPEPVRTRSRVEPAAEVAADPEEAAEAEAEVDAAPRSRRRRARRGAEPEVTPVDDLPVEVADADETAEADDEEDDEDDDDSPAARRRRRRGRRGRGRGRGGADDDEEDDDEPAAAESDAEAETDDEDGSDEPMTRRRRRRRRKGAADTEPTPDDPNVVVKIREPRTARDEVQGVSGSTRLEAKRQRRRDGREQRRTRPPILSEAEFLARREAVDRVMVVRQRGDRTQIAVLEDGILVEHYVTRSTSATLVGSVFLGRVQNVLPSMEAAFVDVGRGRNAVLYAGEVNWDATGLEGRTRTIEQALKSGDSVLVQVTKDPIGTKGARLTSHIALSGRHLVYVPHGNASGISRKLSDVERKRLRDVLKNLVPDGAGVIVRTAAEGASEDELERDVTRLQAQWEAIQEKATTVNAPAPLYEEPDLVIRVVRDLFNEDFRELVIQGNDAYDLVEPYLGHVSPDLVDRLRRHTGTGDVFAELRIDEQLMKALDRKVFLPSGGSLVIDRTEAMTVIDVNTGKYTGAGGNLEQTVTRNNLEAAEEIVRQLRLRDIGGIIVIDFIDMVLESNRELVLRRLTECLGRDRTKHQVTEITSLGLVQMTRKRVGQGLLEAFSETCEHCKGRGLIIHPEPVGDKRSSAGNGDRSALAKVAAASNGTPGTGGEGEEGSRSGRRRGRRGAGAATATEEPPVDVDDDDVAVDDVAVPAADDEDDVVVPLDDDEPAEGAELRRRSRRGGTRRRTRP